MKVKVKKDGWRERKRHENKHLRKKSCFFLCSDGNRKQETGGEEGSLWKEEERKDSLLFLNLNFSFRDMLEAGNLKKKTEISLSLQKKGKNLQTPI